METRPAIPPCDPPDSPFAAIVAMADLLDRLQIGLCLFDDADRTLLWNRCFLQVFPEHEGHVAVGEPYAENLRRFYRARLAPAEMGAIEQCIAEGIARHRTQTDPYVFEHRGRWVRVAAQPVPGLGRIRIWTPVAPPQGSLPPDPVLPFEGEEGDGRTVLDPAGRIIAANARIARLFGLAASAEAVGATHAALLRAAWAGMPGEAARAAAQTLAEAERFAGVPFELPLPGDVWLRVLQHRLADGRTVTSFADISATKRLQRELIVAREAAEQANRAKDALLATVSHELRTPLSGILGMLALLEGHGLGAEAVRRVGVAHAAARGLLHLVDDILAFSRLEAGQLGIEQAPTCPAALLAEVTELLRPRAAEKGLALTVSIAADTPECVLADAARLRQVLTNLLGNALKFTGQGAVELSVAPVAAAVPGRVVLAFTVSDTGIGIARASLGAIFERFRQADPGIARRYGGSGLGLAISRDLAHAMGGEITVESREGEGSRFTLTLDCAIATPLAAPREDDLPALPALRVLVVEDEPVNREVMRLLLGRLGMRVVEAADAAAALRAASAPLDLVLMDLDLPGMGGTELAERLRASGLPGGSAPVIALTAHAGEAHRAAVAAAGFRGFLTKPVGGAALAKAITAALDRGETEAGVAGALDAERVALLASLLPAEDWSRLVEEFEDAGESALDDLAAPDESRQRQAAHRLKGIALNFGARRLGDLAASVEGMPAAARRPVLPELRRALDASIQALRATAP